MKTEDAMFATLTDKTGNRVEIELLDVSERLFEREAPPLVLKRFVFESPLPVETPGAYQLELEDGSLIETEVTYCQVLPSGAYALAGFRLEGVPVLAGR